MQKPKLWNYKSGIKKRKLRPKAKSYLSFKLKDYWKKKRIKEKIEEEQQEEIIKKQFKRESVVLTAYYQGTSFFDWRVSIINSEKRDTLAYLQKVLTNRWEKWAWGERAASGWNFVIEALESEFIDVDEVGKQILNKLIWEKR